MSARLVWLIERNGEFFAGRGLWCSNPFHAVQYTQRGDAQAYLHATFDRADDAMVVSRCLSDAP